MPETPTPGALELVRNIRGGAEIRDHAGGAQSLSYALSDEQAAEEINRFAAQRGAAPTEISRIETAAFLRGRDAGKHEAGLEAKYGSFTPGAPPQTGERAREHASAVLYRVTERGPKRCERTAYYGT
jgi:hypothetical protein